MPELRRWAYVDPAGTEHVLSDPAAGWKDGRGNFTCCRGVLGVGAPPVSFTEQGRPGQAGTQVRGKPYYGPRDIDMVLRLEGADAIALRILIREWLRWFLTSTPGRLRCYSPAGTREIPAYYAGGLELDETPGPAGPNWVTPTLSFHCPDPYFTTGKVITPAPYSVVTTRPFFPMSDGAGSFALNLASSSVARSDVARNDGDVDAFPRWTITGPGGPVTLTNRRTGKVLTWTGTIPAGQMLILDTDPDVGTAVLDDGTKVYKGRIPDGSKFWPLPPGESPLGIEVGGATVATRVQLTYALRLNSL